MQCQELHRDELAEKYLNGQLDPAAQDEFEIHLLECVQCLRQVEAVQNLRQELDERAHQIRAYSQVEHSRFRWKWITVAAFSLVICGLGAIELGRMKSSKSAVTHVPAPASAASSASSSPSSSAPLTADNRPVNSRNYINFTPNDSRVTRDKAPSTGSSPSTGLNLKSQRARSNLVNVDGADATDNSVNGVRSSVSPAVAPSGEVPPASAKSQTPEIGSDETAKELFRLGTVQAPPYTFSGFASSSGHGASLDPGALSGKPGRSPNSQARPFFRDAMDAYVDKRYADATDLLEQAAKAEPNATDVNFYLGVCRLLRAKPTDSIAPLQAVLVNVNANAKANDTSPWAQAAHFYLAKAYIQIGDLADAETQLQSAATLRGRLSAEARSELTRLQAVRASEKPRIPGSPNP
jgi:tetratricopeptide (TPR) repeat protein